MWICFRILSLKTKDTSASSWLFDFVPLWNVILLFNQIWRYFANTDMHFSLYQYKFCKIMFLRKQCALKNATFRLWETRSPKISTKRNITFSEKSVLSLKTGECIFPEKFMYFFFWNSNIVFREIHSHSQKRTATKSSSVLHVWINSEAYSVQNVILRSCESVIM